MHNVLRVATSRSTWRTARKHAATETNEVCSMQPNLAHIGLEHVVPETVLRSTSLVVVQLCHHILRSTSNNYSNIHPQHTTDNDATVCTHARTSCTERIRSARLDYCASDCRRERRNRMTTVALFALLAAQVPLQRSATEMRTLRCAAVGSCILYATAEPATVGSCAPSSPSTGAARTSVAPVPPALQYPTVRRTHRRPLRWRTRPCD